MESSLQATDDYLNLLLSRPELSPNATLALFLLTLFRIIPIMTLAPFLGAKNLPSASKMMFGVALTAMMSPYVILTAKADLDFNTLFIVYAIKEIVIGLIIGFLASIPFYIGMTSGSLIDHVRGASSLQITDPSTQTQTGPLGLLYNYVLIALFFIIGGPFYFFSALADSFQLIPVDGYFQASFFQANVPFWRVFTQLLYRIMSLALQLAAPSLIGILMVEMFLGITNRMAPQVQIVFLGIPLKSWVGIFLLALAWIFILQQLSKETLNWIEVVQKMFFRMQPFHVVP